MYFYLYIIFHSIGVIDIIKKEIFICFGYRGQEWDLNLSTKIYFRFIILSPLVLLLIIINIIFDLKSMKTIKFKNLLNFAIFTLLIYLSINNILEFLGKKEHSKFVKPPKSTYLEKLIKNSEQLLDSKFKNK